MSIMCWPPQSQLRNGRKGSTFIVHDFMSITAWAIPCCHLGCTDRGGFISDHFSSFCIADILSSILVFVIILKKAEHSGQYSPIYPSIRYLLTSCSVPGIVLGTGAEHTQTCLFGLLSLVGKVDLVQCSRQYVIISHGRSCERN